jgi:hypothetical protein
VAAAPGFTPPPPMCSTASSGAYRSTLPTSVSNSDPTFAAIAQLLRTAPPKLPADAQGGRFLIDQDGVVYVIPKPKGSDEDYLLNTSQAEASRWLDIAGLQSHASGTAEGRKLKTLFNSLTEPVRSLELLRRAWPFPDELLDLLAAARESLWHRLRCLVIQAKHGPVAALSYEEGEMEGEEKKEAAAAAKGRKQDQPGSSAAAKKKRGAGGGKKTCNICGGASHLWRDCPKGKSNPSK